MLNVETVRSRLPSELKSSANLGDVVEEVISDFEDRTGIFWNERSGYVETWPTNGTERTLRLPLKVVSSVDLVRERNYNDSDWTTVDADDYFLSGSRSLSRINNHFADLVEVTISGGYSPSTLPRDIKMALITQVSFVLSRDTNIDLKSQNFEGGAGVFMDADCHPRYKQCVKRNMRLV